MREPKSSPPGVPYTFWHQLEHMRIAQQDLLEYIRGEYRHKPWPLDYWPAADTESDAFGWLATLAAIEADRAALEAMVDDPEVDLLAPVDHMDNRSIFRAVVLVIDHNAYHLGEFVMARQPMGAWESRLDQ